jgi:hypothetical protein
MVETAVWSHAETGIPQGWQKISPAWKAASFAAFHAGVNVKK